jgi:hypothetical protein
MESFTKHQIEEAQKFVDTIQTMKGVSQEFKEFMKQQLEDLKKK